MTIRNIYVAADGEEFETEEECLEYEKTRDASDAILMFNSNNQIIEDIDSVTAFEKSMYLYILNAEKAKKFFAWINESYGYAVPDPDGVNGNELYAFDEDRYSQSYYKLGNRIAELEVLQDELLDRVQEKLGAKWMGLERGWVNE